jgi:hypothetical protein
MASYDASLGEQAVGFISGGTLGLGLSLTLAARADESLSKTGLAFLATSSLLGLLQGVSLAVRGDALTREAEALDELDTTLKRVGVSEDRRQRALDRHLVQRLTRLRDERDQVRLWNGLVSLAAAAGGALSLQLARERSTGSQIGLGLFTLATGVYGVASLLPASGARGISDLQARLELRVFPYGPAAGVVASLP